ncbi:MAG: prepilin-type N-terminal cleavage/methylation domain-containing protein [Planctomycetes bacterium]|nr:prepilin-type N-terminal cleavage/methylation domain-containing protein [Planctomycetota bacterium]NOG54501.1 prepilin-type N-terminal cleavage/methylation domain-containing protein [Planctomycetota bacterium]
MSNKTSYRAFTLIELLVVISIIALLIGILLPALSRARITGKEMMCLSQLRQIGQGQHAYALSFSDFYSPGYATDIAGDVLENSWYRALSRFMDGKPEVWDCPIATDRHPDVGYMQEIVPGFEATELTWSQINYGLPVYCYSMNGADRPSYGGAMGLSFEDDLYYGARSQQRDMTPCRTDKVKHPDRFAMAGDTNNIGINSRQPDLLRRVGFHGCPMTTCQSSAHGDVPPGEEQHPKDAAANQWVFGDGHAVKMTYAEVIATDGRMFRRDGGYFYTERGG